MMTIVGHCPQCGAPIYTESVWMGITPPPNYYTCNCFAEQKIAKTKTSTSYEID